jgi:hypothetical protein
VARRACFGGAGTRTLPRGRASNAAASSTFRRRAIGGLGRPRRRACRWLCDCGVCRGGLGPGRAAPRFGGRDPRARRRARGDGPSPDADAPSRASPLRGAGSRARARRDGAPRPGTVDDAAAAARSRSPWLRMGALAHDLRHERVGFRRGVRGLIDEVRLRCSPALGVVLARCRLRLADPPVPRGADGAHGARPARTPPHDGRRARRAHVRITVHCNRCDRRAQKQDGEHNQRRPRRSPRPPSPVSPWRVRPAVRRGRRDHRHIIDERWHAGRRPPV